MGIHSSKGRTAKRGPASQKKPSAGKLTSGYVRERGNDEAKRKLREKSPYPVQVSDKSRTPNVIKVAVYKKKGGRVDDFLSILAKATPIEIVEVERTGVPGMFIKDLSKRLEIPSKRFFKILGIPKATAEKKAATQQLVSGSGGQAAIGMARLIGIAQRIANESTANEAKTFDAPKWLGQWIERPQPSLGGRKPADLLDTPTGLEVVTRLLGSIESGAYQ